ncbi:MAG: hypothetical protein CMD99_09150 [Gammaproteobacteria bacterium]|nr:hypothetical protein [Gammaproteobacteria bacterium]
MKMQGLEQRLVQTLAFFIPLSALIYALNIPIYLNFVFYREQFLIAFASLACAFVFLSNTNISHVLVNEYFDQIFRRFAALICISYGGYGTVYYESILFMIGFITWDKVLVASLGIFFLLEALRRCTGYVLVVLGITALCLPLILGSISDGEWVRTIPLDRMLTLIFFGQGGIHGIPIAVAATIVSVFIIFGRGLIMAGGGDSIRSISGYLVGRDGGGDKVAVVASGLFGSLSGSASANVATTGVMTIPLMQSQGIPSHRAAAIEAVASTGGLILPPIMAATGFLIAEYLAIPYSEVAIAAVVPGLLFYGCIFLYCHYAHLYVPKVDADNVGSNKTTLSTKRLFWDLAPFFVPITVLIVLLFAFYQSAEISAVGGIMAALGVGYANGRIRLSVIFGKLFRDAAPQIVEITIICGCAGIIIGVLGITGIGASLSRLILQIAGNNLWIVTIVSALACIILGMGVPVTATYVIVIGLVAPALISFDVHPLAAHLFVFYFGTLSFLTPPVCLSVFVAANLAHSKIGPTVIEALKIAAPAYLLPLLFVMEPGLIGVGSFEHVAFVITLTIIGLGALTVMLLPVKVRLWNQPVVVTRLAAALVAALSLGAVIS